MTQIEQIKAEIERRMKNNQQDATESGEGAFYEDKELLSFINSLPTKQPNKDLEEEINDYFERHFEICNDNTIKCGGEEFGTYELLDVIEHFTNWQKEQMMKSAIDAVIVNDETSGCVVDCEQGCLVLEPHRYPIGQKLKILIIKEGE